ncbi:MAG: hypothetical protein KDK71_01535 [Chlamydiia bacterium]|nr:hypothetical protein [Chlamydiia bacterium]
MDQWSKLHSELQTELSKEITLRQDILGNMSQQEYLLLTGNNDLKEALYIECKKLVHQLKGLLKIRSTLTRKVFDHLPKNILGNKLDEVLDPLVDAEGETLMLYKSVQELTKKIHQQKLRNKTLQEMIVKNGPLQINNEAIHSEPTQNKQGKKLPLITIDYPKSD